MRKFVSEHQSPYLDLTTEVSDILYRGHSQFQDIIVADSKEFGRMLVLDGVFQTSIKDEFMYHESIVHIPLFLHPNPKKSSSSAAAMAALPGKPSVIRKSNRSPWSTSMARSSNCPRNISRKSLKPSLKRSQTDRQVGDGIASCGKRKLLRRHHRRLLGPRRPWRRTVLV